MPKKPSFSLDSAIGRLTKPSVFARIVSEIDTNQIPSRYIEQILVQCQDGSVVDLSGDKITWPAPVDKNALWANLEESFSHMQDVKIFINTSILEEDVNILVEQLLGKLC